MAIRLVIEVDDAGKMSLQGPLENKVVCYGILESAKDVIRAFQAQAQPEQRRVVPAGIMPVWNGGRRE